MQMRLRFAVRLKDEQKLRKGGPMPKEKSYFCPDCGWEGEETLCAICGSPTESLSVDPTTGKVVDDDTLSDDLGDEFDDDFDDEDEIDLTGEDSEPKHAD